MAMAACGMGGCIDFTGTASGAAGCLLCEGGVDHSPVGDLPQLPVPASLSRRCSPPCICRMPGKAAGCLACRVSGAGRSEGCLVPRRPFYGFYRWPTAGNPYWGTAQMRLLPSANRDMSRFGCDRHVRCTVFALPRCRPRRAPVGSSRCARSDLARAPEIQEPVCARRP